MTNKAQIVITAQDKASAVLGEVSRNMRTVDDNTLRLRQSLVGLAAAYGGLNIVKDVITTGASFQQSIANLAAITGASGDELKYLTDQSREMGKTTKYTANQVADAFTIVASKKPELLDNAEALSKVTHESLILAEAAGSTLPDAATALTASLNEFNAGADQSTRYINALAAAQKYGSSMVNDTTEALKMFGTVAGSIGHLSFEETLSAIELVAKRQILATQAGTNLRGMLLNLEKQSNNQFKPSVVGLADAFKNLNAANLDAAEKVKLFGKRNIAAAQALMDMADQIQPLTDKITGTNIAYEQAHIRINTLIGDAKALTSALHDQYIGTELFLDPSLRVLTESLTMVIRGQQQSKDAADATRESSLQLAIDMGVLADAAVNAAHGIELPFQVLGKDIAAAGAALDFLIHGQFSEAKAVISAWESDLAKLGDNITDPSRIHTFEDNARKLVASLKAADQSKPPPLDLSIPSILPTIADLAKFDAAQQRAADITQKLSAAALAQANILKQLRGQFDQQQAARLRSEQVMSASARALAGQDQQIEQRKITAMQKALDLRSRQTITDGEYKKMLEAIDTEVVRQQKDAAKTQSAIDAMNSSWEHGAKQAMQDYIDTARNTAALTKNLFTDAFSSMEDALVNFTQTGKLDFKAFADSIVADITRIIVKQEIEIPLMQAMGFSGGSGPSGSFLSGIGSSIASFLGFAHGGVFTGGVHAFADGGLVGSPTLFRFANGGGFSTGIMGEAGTEAIMPLKRGPDGKLGVAGGGNVTVNMSMPVTINAPGSDVSVVPKVRQALDVLHAQIIREIPAVVRQAQIRNRVTPTV